VSTAMTFSRASGTSSCWVALLFLLVSTAVHARVLHVAANGDGSDGSSWERAFPTVSAALVVAVTGDAVWVKFGRYREALDLKGGIGVYGGFAGMEGEDEFYLRNWQTNETIIDASGFGRSAVTTHDVTSVTMDGFTVTGGEGPDDGSAGGVDIVGSHVDFRNCHVTGNVADEVGGFRIEESTVSIVSCTVERNAGPYGRFRIAAGVMAHNSILLMRGCVVRHHFDRASDGAVMVYGYGVPYGATIENCTIMNNVGALAGGIQGWRNVTVAGCYIAHNTAESFFGGGGGVQISDNCLIRDCTIENNCATFGGGVYVDLYGTGCSVVGSRIADNYAREDGGGVEDSAENTSFHGCEIVGNRAGRDGGGVLTSDGSRFEECVVLENVSARRGGGIYGSALVNRCRISKNHAEEGGGGCMMIGNVPRRLTNCIIAENESEDRGGGVYMYHAWDRRSILNCTFSGNKAPRGNTVFISGGNGLLQNCIFGMGGTNEVWDDDTTMLQYCSMPGENPGLGNIDCTPKFTDSENGDYRLLADSACIDSGSTDGPEVDFDGNIRPVDIPGIGRDGEGAFDIGAYEYPLGGYASPVPTPVPMVDERSDVNEDGRVNAEDLLILLRDWQKVSAP
jgi:parallel beta helix pectate lyase-like protein